MRREVASSKNILPEISFLVFLLWRLLDGAARLFLPNTLQGLETGSKNHLVQLGPNLL